MLTNWRQMTVWRFQPKARFWCEIGKKKRKREKIQSDQFRSLKHFKRRTLEKNQCRLLFPIKMNDSLTLQFHSSPKSTLRGNTWLWMNESGRWYFFFFQEITNHSKCRVTAASENQTLENQLKMWRTYFAKFQDQSATRVSKNEKKN